MSSNHPCFDAEARNKFARVHLPVAPRCNMQCHYCSRDFSCANESRPGVSVRIITPLEAIEYVRRVKAKLDNLSVVGIAGPGDPFANPEETMETLRLVKKEFPELLLCVATNGLNLLPYVDELADLQVSHVTVTVNAVNPAIGAGCYAWMRFDKKARTGLEAAEYLWHVQEQAIKALKARNVTVKINTIYVPTINDDHIEEIAIKMKELGADMMNIIPLYPVKDTVFSDFKEPDHADLFVARTKAGKHVQQMMHCQRCRADACGILGQDNEEAKQILSSDLRSTVEAPAEVLKGKTRIAIATREGVLVNQHLGEAELIHVYEPGNPVAIAVRKAPTNGLKDERWELMADLLEDCSHLLCSGVGDKPKEVLSKRGIKVVMLEGLIQDAIELLGKNKNLDSMCKSSFACGSKCQGNGNGCG